MNKSDMFLIAIHLLLCVCLKKFFFVCIFKDMDREFRKLMRWFGKTHKPYKVIIKVYIVHVQCSLMF